jgi:hypothetical protein
MLNPPPPPRPLSTFNPRLQACLSTLDALRSNLTAAVNRLKSSNDRLEAKANGSR